jgi:3-isopropylmalate/(R)-2-methylmalate dehydratase small subunit
MPAPPGFRGAPRANLGCGSSREHAPWALLDCGLRAILAPSFSDIFYNNCFKNGILPVRLADDGVNELFARTTATPGYELMIDLGAMRITDDSGAGFTFDVDPFRRDCLLMGWDDIGLTLRHENKIREYESGKF